MDLRHFGADYENAICMRMQRMKQHTKFISVGALILALGGCAGQELSSVEGLETSGSAFNRALYAEYLDR